MTYIDIIKLYAKTTPLNVYWGEGVTGYWTWPWTHWVYTVTEVYCPQCWRFVSLIPPSQDRSHWITQVGLELKILLAQPLSAGVIGKCLSSFLNILTFKKYSKALAWSKSNSFPNPVCCANTSVFQGNSNVCLTDICKTQCYILQKLNMLSTQRRKLKEKHNMLPSKNIVNKFNQNRIIILDMPSNQ